MIISYIFSDFATEPLIINFKYESKEQREFFVYYFQNHDNKLHKSLYNLLKKRKEYNVVEKEMKYVNAIEKRIIKNLVNLIEKSHNTNKGEI